MTTEQKVTRKLRAILSADVKGYSLLMTNDEASTIKTLKEYRIIMSEIIEQHSGRVVDAPGDNLLAELSSAVNAIQCSVEIQNELKTRNAELPDEKRMEFRIGVNIGDVVQDGDSLYGEGVNIAARIEGLSDPSGVCISRGAYDHVKNKLKLGYEFIGEHAVKNIKDPVRVYKVLMDPEDAGKLIGEKPKSQAAKWIFSTIAVAAIAFTLIFYQLYQKMSAPEFEPASIEKMAYTLPVEPSIAVLPFENMSGDPEQEYFSDGITEQIITSLSNVPYLFVIARNSTFTYKNKPVKVQQVAEELGVQYILEGSVQRSDDRIRITAQLIDAITGYHIWAENFDRKVVDIFQLQDEITMKIIAKLQVELSTTELGRLSSIKTGNLRAYEKYLKGYRHIYNRSIGDTLQARKLAEEAIELDPEYGAAYQLMALTYLDEIYMHRVESRDEFLGKAEKLIQKSIELSGKDYKTHRTLSSLYFLKKQSDKAIIEAQKAIELNPNSADSYYIYGMILGLIGNYDQAISNLKKAIRLNPVSPIHYLNHLAFAYAYKNQYEKAIPLWELTLKRNPDYYYAHIGLTAAYQLNGERDKARKAAAELIRVKPSISISMLEKRVVQKNKESKALFLGALRKAGLPEYPPGKETEKPSIAVLPFVNMSDDPKQEYFSDGITEDIITALSKTAKMFVIARNSTFTYKGKSVKVQEVGRDLGVRYVLEGSVRKADNKVRITAQLIDARTGHHLWAEKYDRDLKDIFAIQDDITKQIIAALHVKLTIGEDASIIARNTNSLEAYLKYLQAREYHYKFTKEGNHNSRRLVEDVISIDPEYGSAYSLLGATHMLDVWLQATDSPKKSLGKAIELQKKAISLGVNVHHVLGFIYSMVGQLEKATAECQQAVQLNPNSVLARTFNGLVLNKTGRFKEAVNELEQGLRLDPFATSLSLRSLGTAYCNDGRPEDAIAVCKKAIEKAPNDLLTRIVFIQAYSLAGKHGEAQKEAAEVLRINPKFTLKLYAKSLGYKNKSDTDRWITSLRKAGLPD